MNTRPLVAGGALLVVMARGMPAQACSTTVVSRAELLAAMRGEQGYNLVATTNWARFQTGVFLRLAHAAQARDSSGRLPLLIRAEDWFWNYVEVAGLNPDSVPTGTKLAHDLHQDMQLDYNPAHVISAVRQGPAPLLAMNVRIAWPAGPGVPDHYSYEDKLSDPQLKVSSQQTITYRLVDFGDIVLYDEIVGVTGRPNSGFLGALFWLIGEGDLLQSRMAISPDGVLVVRAHSHRLFFSITPTVTVQPDGRGGAVPDGDVVMATLKARLDEPLDLVYKPYAC